MPFEEEIEPKIQKIRRRWGFLNRFLPTALAKLLVDIEWAKEQRKRHNRISTECEQLLEELRELEVVLHEQIESLQESMAEPSVDVVESVEAEIAEAHALLDRFEDLDEQYLKQKQSQEIIQLSNVIESHLDWINEYLLVGQSIPRAVDLLRAVERALNPSGTSDQNNTPPKQDIISMLDEAEAHIEYGLEAYERTQAGDQFVDELYSLQEQCQEYQELVKNRTTN